MFYAYIYLILVRMTFTMLKKNCIIVSNNDRKIIVIAKAKTWS